MFYFVQGLPTLSCNKCSYLLLIKEPNTIRLSSISATISEVLSPRRSSSPRFLKFAKVSSLVLQSATTDFSLASMSFSLTAAMQTSYRRANMSLLIYLFCYRTVDGRAAFHLYLATFRVKTVSIFQTVQDTSLGKFCPDGWYIGNVLQKTLNTY